MWSMVFPLIKIKETYLFQRLFFPSPASLQKKKPQRQIIQERGSWIVSSHRRHYFCSLSKQAQVWLVHEAKQPNEKNIAFCSLNRCLLCSLYLRWAANNVQFHLLKKISFKFFLFDLNNLGFAKSKNVLVCSK